MRIPRPRLKTALVLLAGAVALSGCVAYPAPGYYAAYGDPYYAPGPYYYGPPAYGAVVIGGGGGRFHHRWR